MRIADLSGRTIQINKSKFGSIPKSVHTAGGCGHGAAKHAASTVGMDKPFPYLRTRIVSRDEYLF
jgi:hypothetical protein